MGSNHNVEEKTIESDKNKIGNVKIVFMSSLFKTMIVFTCFMLRYVSFSMFDYL